MADKEWLQTNEAVRDLHREVTRRSKGAFETSDDISIRDGGKPQPLGLFTFQDLALPGGFRRGNLAVSPRKADGIKGDAGTPASGSRLASASSGATAARVAVPRNQTGFQISQSASPSINQRNVGIDQRNGRADRNGASKTPGVSYGPGLPEPSSLSKGSQLDSHADSSPISPSMANRKKKLKVRSSLTGSENIGSTASGMPDANASSSTDKDVNIGSMIPKPRFPSLSLGLANNKVQREAERLRQVAGNSSGNFRMGSTFGGASGSNAVPGDRNSTVINMDAIDGPARTLGKPPLMRKSTGSGKIMTGPPPTIPETQFPGAFPGVTAGGGVTTGTSLAASSTQRVTQRAKTSMPSSSSIPKSNSSTNATGNSSIAGRIYEDRRTSLTDKILHFGTVIGAVRRRRSQENASSKAKSGTASESLSRFRPPKTISKEGLQNLPTDLPEIPRLEQVQEEVQVDPRNSLLDRILDFNKDYKDNFESDDEDDLRFDDFRSDIYRDFYTVMLTKARIAHGGARYARGDMTVRATVLSIFKLFFCSGILFIPKAFANGGSLFSFFCIFLMVFTTTLTILQLIELRQRLNPELQRLGLDKHTTYGDVAFLCLGRMGKYCVDASIFLSQAAYGMSYPVIIAQCFAYGVFNLADSTSQQFKDCVDRLILFEMVFLVPLVWVRKLSNLSLATLFGDVVIFSILIFCFCYSVYHVYEEGVAPGVIYAINGDTFGLTIGTSIFAFEGIGCIMPVVASMRKPETFPRVFLACILFIGSAFAFFGLAVYWANGSEVPTNAILTLPKSPYASLEPDDDQLLAANLVQSAFQMASEEPPSQGSHLVEKPSITWTYTNSSLGSSSDDSSSHGSSWDSLAKRHHFMKSHHLSHSQHSSRSLHAGTNSIPSSLISNSTFSTVADFSSALTQGDLDRVAQVMNPKHVKSNITFGNITVGPVPQGGNLTIGYRTNVTGTNVTAAANVTIGKAAKISIDPQGTTNITVAGSDQTGGKATQITFNHTDPVPLEKIVSKQLVSNTTAPRHKAENIAKGIVDYTVTHNEKGSRSSLPWFLLVFVNAFFEYFTDQDYTQAGVYTYVNVFHTLYGLGVICTYPLLMFPAIKVVESYIFPPTLAECPSGEQPIHRDSGQTEVPSSANQVASTQSLMSSPTGSDQTVANPITGSDLSAPLLVSLTQKTPLPSIKSASSAAASASSFLGNLLGGGVLNPLKPVSILPDAARRVEKAATAGTNPTSDMVGVQFDLSPPTPTPTSVADTAIVTTNHSPRSSTAEDGQGPFSGQSGGAGVMYGNFFSTAGIRSNHSSKSTVRSENHYFGGPKTDPEKSQTRNPSAKSPDVGGPSSQNPQSQGGQVIEYQLVVPKGQHRWEKNFFRFCVIAVFVIVAKEGAQHLDVFVAVMGALFCIPIGLIYPPFMMVFCRKQALLNSGCSDISKLKYSHKRMLYLQILFGFACMIYSLWSCLEDPQS